MSYTSAITLAMHRTVDKTLRYLLTEKNTDSPIFADVYVDRLLNCAHRVKILGQVFLIYLS